MRHFKTFQTADETREWGSQAPPATCNCPTCQGQRKSLREDPSLRESRERGLSNAEEMIALQDEGDPLTQLTDAIANLMHWGQREGVEWDEAERIAQGHFQEEQP